MKPPAKLNRRGVLGLSSGILLFSLLPLLTDSFTVLPNKFTNSPFPIASSPRPSLCRLFAGPEIKEMKLKDMRAELESYGISTKTFLEKREFVDALQKARDEGMTPKASKESVNGDAKGSSRDAYSSYNQDTVSANTNTKTQQTKTAEPKKQTQTKASRADRIKEAMEQAKSMRVSELKQKLKELGVSTKSFFEKTEFVRAYAEAVVDGVGKSKSKQPQEDYDPEYRDVVMQKFDPNSQQRYLLGGTIIDIKV